MANFIDKQVNISDSFGDTNINVFMFGFLPITEVFEYGGAGYFGDKSTDVSAGFRGKNTSIATNFSDRTINE